MKNFHGYSDYFFHEYIYLFKYLFIKFKILSINMQKYEGTPSQDLICRFNPEKQKGPQLLSVLVASLLYYPSSRCYLVSTPRATEAIF